MLKSSKELRFIFLALPEGAAPAPQRRSRCLCSEPWGRPGGPAAGCPSLAGKVSPGFVVIALGFAGRRGRCRAVLCHEISSPALSEGLLAGVWRGYVLGAGFLLGFFFFSASGQGFRCGLLCVPFPRKHRVLGKWGWTLGKSSLPRAAAVPARDGLVPSRVPVVTGRCWPLRPWEMLGMKVFCCLLPSLTLSWSLRSNVPPQNLPSCPMERAACGGTSAPGTGQTSTCTVPGSAKKMLKIRL